MVLTVKAIHTFVAEHGDELDFSAGEDIVILEKDEAFGDGWWRGRNVRGEEGLFPATYIEETLPAEEATQVEPIVKPSESPKGGSQSLEDHALPAPTNVMGTTLDSIQQAIESIEKPEAEDAELGIGQDTRAKLAEQAKRANEQKERNRVSGGVNGLLYSDESDDEDEPAAIPLPTSPPSTSLPTITTHLTSLEPPFTPAPTESRSVSTRPPGVWSITEVYDWAVSKGFDEGICEKFKEHEITGDLLLELDANLLKELDIPQFGKRLRIAQAIAELRPDSVRSAHVPPTASSSNASLRLSAPPSAIASTSPTPPVPTPPLATSPMSAASEEYQGWTHSRKASSTHPAMQAIKEGQPTPGTVASMPTSPVTPASSTTKRESAGSLGHKRGKLSMDGRDRLSFFGRNRKPAPPTSPGMDQRSLSRNGGKAHHMQPAPLPQSGTAAALTQIGTPDHSGYMKKKGETYGWKMRFFVLKGSHMYYMKNEDDDRVKGHIDLRGHRVVVDENTNPGSYGFRLVGPDRPHAFSSTEQAAIRAWMKALMKATIARDYSVPVTSSCNIPTIPLAEAQALAPRPPSPATRDATQRATRRENTNTLTAHDANILMSFDSKRSSMPDRPTRDTRRPSSQFPRSLTAADREQYQPILDWVNSTLPPPFPRASALPESFISGEVIFLLVRSLSGIEPSPPVPPNAFAPDASGQPGVAGLFAMMDILIDAGIDPVGVTPNEVRSGDAAAIASLLESVRRSTSTSNNNNSVI